MGGNPFGGPSDEVQTWQVESAQLRDKRKKRGISNKPFRRLGGVAAASAKPPFGLGPTASNTGSQRSHRGVNAPVALTATGAAYAKSTRLGAATARRWPE